MTSTQNRTDHSERASVSHNTRSMRGVAHAWYPHSGCGKACADAGVRGERDSLGAIAARLVGLVRLPVVIVAAMAIMGLPRRLRVTQGPRAAIWFLGIFGIDVVIDNEPDAQSALRRGALIAVNHHTWWDVPVLAAVALVRFVARADIADAPVAGPLLTRLGTVYIDRNKLRELPLVVDRVATLLREGHNLVTFPEATTWCGHAHGRMRPALFQAAVDAQVPVIPVSVEYRAASGDRTTAAAFVGRETVVASLWNLVSGRVKTVHVRLGAPLVPGHDAADRRELAERAQLAVFGRSGELPH